MRGRRGPSSMSLQRGSPFRLPFSQFPSTLHFAGCETDLPHFCHSCRHLCPHVHPHTLRLLRGDQVSFCSENGIIIFLKLNFSRQDGLVYGEKISPDKWTMWLWWRNGGGRKNCQARPNHQQPKTSGKMHVIPSVQYV